MTDDEKLAYNLQFKKKEKLTIEEPIELEFNAEQQFEYVKLMTQRRK